MFDEEPDGDPHGECAAEIARLNALAEQAREALEPFANIGAWLFARNLPDNTPLIDVYGLNGEATPLTRGHFKAAHAAVWAMQLERKVKGEIMEWQPIETAPKDGTE